MPLSDQIISFLGKNPDKSSKEIHEEIGAQASYATVKRELQKLLNQKLISTSGLGRATLYAISPVYQLFYTVDIDEYFQNEIDERTINSGYNFELIPNILTTTSIFNEEEQQVLENLQQLHAENVSLMSASQYSKEMQRLAVDLSWKSSQIEGNTYSLLETERLLFEKETAAGKTKDEAVMLLNHKDALDFIFSNRHYLSPLAIRKIEDIHSILIKELNIDRNIRNRRVGISGTNYRPLDNEFQIREALDQMCQLINSKEDVFEKALLALALIAYIQPFEDGNKRTSRIVSNAILIQNNYCPISFRTVDSIDYKKAMLLFYEQNNITAFKQIFIEQFKFAVETYF